MDKAFLAAYSLRLIATCHRRGAFAMGGMSRLHPGQGRRGGQCRRARQGPRRQAARGRQRPRRHLGRAPGAGAGGAGSVRGDGPAPTSWRKCPSSVPGRDEMLELHTRPAHRSRRAREHPRRRPISRRLARRERRGAALQSDGGRGDGRDLPHPAVAMAEVRSAARRRPPLHPRPVRAMVRRGSRPARRSPQHRRCRAI